LFDLAVYVGPLQYNYASFPMLIVLALVVFVKCIKDRPSYKDLFFSFAFLAAIGFILLFLKYPARNVLASLGLPFVVGLLGTTVYRILKSVFRSPRHFRFYSDAKYVVFFGVAVLLIGVFISSTTGVTTTTTVTVGESFNAAGLKLSIVEVATTPSSRHIFLPPYGILPESIDSEVTYTIGDAPSIVKTAYVKYYPTLDQFVSTPSIDSSLWGDTYIVAGATESVRAATALVLANSTSSMPSNINITVKTIPAVSLVWLGVAIMVIGNLPFVFVSLPMRENREEMQHIRDEREEDS
jgi:cytochrome c biogenesis factor